MDFLNKAKASIASASKDLSQKASEGVELAKISSKIRDIEKDYEELTKTLTQTLLKDHYDEVKALCPDIVESIEKNREELEAAKSEQTEIKGGTAAASAGVAAATGAKFCPNCGKAVPDGAKFCSGCGNAIE